MAEVTSYPMPKWALPVWYDKGAIFVALPTESDPYIVRFPFTEAGLNKVLQIMKYTQEECHKKSSRMTERKHPLVKRISKGKVQPDFTDDQRARALAVLKKAGIIK